MRQMNEDTEVRWLDRWLYRNYRQGSAAGHFVVQRVKPAAWLLMGVLGVSVLMGANLGKSVVIVMTAMVGALLLVGFLWAVLRRAKVSGERVLPKTGAVGESFHYRVKLWNDGKSTLRDVAFQEGGNDTRPSQWEFLYLREPGEEKRNFFDRTLAFYRWKWLSDRGGYWDTESNDGRTDPVTLEPGEVQEVSLKLTPRKRGLLLFSDLRAELPDPLGLFQRSRRVWVEPCEVLIIPRRYRLPPLDLGGQSDLRLGGETASVVRGEGGEFMGLREYRAGDSLRKIHWKAWARTGQPIVKEFEEVRFARYGLILDTNLKASDPDLLEEAISVAASFVSTMDREQCLLDLMFVSDQPEVFTAGRGVARVDRLMEILARIQGADRSVKQNQDLPGYEDLRQLVMRYAAEMSAAVVVLAGWDDERRAFIGKLRRSGLALEVYLIGHGEKPDEESLDAVHWLRFGSVQEDLLRKK